MECKIQISVFIFCALAITHSYAYEPPTHENISEAALKNSVLFEADGVLKELGIAIPTKIEAFENPDGSLSDEGNERFHDFFLDRNLGNQRNVIGHIRLGSSYEDKKSLFWACSHFFDPVNQQPLGLGICPAEYNFRSPNWALSGQDSDGVVIFERDDALIRHGNARFLSALTSVDKTTREEYFGTLFRNLGQAIHHLQDMSQPQHVRDDAHLPIGRQASLYEEYSNCKYQVDEETLLPESLLVNIGNDVLNGLMDLFSNNGGCYGEEVLPEVPQTYGELSLAVFNHSRKFWENDGKGIAEFTNANFVSEETNFRLGSLFSNMPLAYTYGEYPLPDPDNGGSGAIITTTLIEAPIPEGLGPDQPLRGEIRFLETTVVDQYAGSNTLNPRTSSFSIFASDLESILFPDPNSPLDPGLGAINLFSLNRFNFDEAQKYLLPRSVAYSTGLINYFFRGRMTVSDVVIYFDGLAISIKVKNVTADKNPDNAAYSFADGIFRLYYDDANGNRYQLVPDDLSAAVLDGAELFENEDELTIDFDLASNGVPIDIDLKKPFTLVFEGEIGHADMAWSGWERGIAATTFYTEPLLSFDISRSDGNAPVANVIDIYASYDLGLNWSPVSESAVSIAFSDVTLDPSNRLGINAVTYIGNRELLVYPDYLDYYSGTPGTIGLSLASLRLSAYGAENVLPGVLLDWGTVVIGQGNNDSDMMTTLRSLVATGPYSLAALRVQHPLLADPPPRSRTFGLLQLPDWSVSTNWVLNSSWGNGGLPELTWLGDDDFVMAVQVEAAETLDPPNARERDSALRKTSDGGLSYTELARIAVCEAEDDFCIQHIVPLDEGRLLGWIEQHASDYPGNNTFYTSPDGGASWEVLGTTPGTTECNPGPLRYTEVNTVIYLGSSRPEVGVVNDVLFIETTCKEIIEVGGFYSGLNIISTNVFASQDSGTNWTEVTKPPRLNGRIIFAGDNGVVPGAFDLP